MPRRFAIALILGLALPTCLHAQARTEFKGRPESKVQETGLERMAEPVPRDRATNLECVISLIGGRYYWASRENTELLRVEAGAFITFVALNGSGYVRVVNPDMKEAAGLLGGAVQKFDYVEHLLLGLASVTYYGRRMPA